jgi:glycosyltransferase involved in cell wall biosynthesis
MEKISIIVNCYNGEKYLKKCISSILNQKFKDFEIIFYDNCSTDNSKKILDEFSNKKIKYFHSDTKLSLYKARNEAIKKSSGSLIAFLDTDDWWDENYLSSKESFFIKKEYDFFYSNVLLFYEKNNNFKKYKNIKFPDGIIYEALVKDYFIIISGLIIKKEILEKEIYFNENYNIIGDYDLLMRISKYANAKSFNDPLVYYRLHEKNFSKLNNKIYYEEYKNWYDKQCEINDNIFNNNKKNFINKLNKLEIIYLLYEKKSFNLVFKILKYPNIFLKLKFLIAFFLPLKLINYLRK